jgi:hypothetical protein
VSEDLPQIASALFDSRAANNALACVFETRDRDLAISDANHLSYLDCDGTSFLRDLFQIVHRWHHPGDSAT